MISAWLVQGRFTPQLPMNSVHIDKLSEAQANIESTTGEGRARVVPVSRICLYMLLDG